MFNPLPIDGQEQREPPATRGGFNALPIEQMPPEPITEAPSVEDKNVILEGAKTAGKFVATELAATAETAMALSSGALLWPFSKAWGVLNLPWGAEAAKKAEESVAKLGYQPYTKEGQAAVELVGKGFDIALKPAKMAGEATRGLDIPLSEEAAYLVELGSELGMFAMAGGAARAGKAKVTKPKFETQVEIKPPSGIKEGLMYEPFKDIAKQTKDLPVEAPGKFKEVPIDLEPKEGPLNIQIEQRIATKYRQLYERPESKLSHQDYQSIVDMKRSPKTLENNILKASNKDQYIIKTEAAIADLLGELHETYKYEGFNEGKAIEAYIDSLLKVVNKHKLPADTLPDTKPRAKTTLPKEGLLADRGVTPKDMSDPRVQKAETVVPEINKVIPGSEIVFDNLYELPAVMNKPPTYNFTPQSGEFAGRTFGVRGEPTLENVVSAFKETTGWKPRTIKDTLADVNALLGERGEIGDAKITPKQTEALNRLKSDAATAKKSVEEMLTEMKVDPKVAALLGQKVTELKKYAGSINLEKQDIPRKFKDFETIIQKPKKVQTWSETTKQATELRSDYKKMAKTLEKGKKGEALTAVEIDATRQVNVNAIRHLKDILETKPEKFKEQYESYKTNVFDVLSDASSEAGRALNIHKKHISINRLTNAFSKLQRELNPRELKEFKELNLENPVEIKQFMDRLGDPKISDYFLEFWYNSILSGPPTHVVNAVGNTAWFLYQIPHRLTSAAVDLPYSKLTGKPRTRYMNEILPMLLGLKTGFKRGAKMAGQMVRHGKIQEFETKWAQEMQSSVGAFERSPYKILRQAAPLITPPTRALRAMDAWANAIAYDAHARSLARRESNVKGLKGKERPVAEKKFVENLTEAQHTESMHQAKHFTFMDDPDPVTGLIIKARNQKVVGPALKMTVLPFVNTISNLMKRGVELTPGIGLVKEAVSRGMGRGRNTPDVIAKQIEGAVITAYVWNKIQKGEITGEMPERKTEREAWYRQGKAPYSMKMDSTWVSYRRAEPYNTVIASAHSAYEAALGSDKQEDIDTIFFDAASRMKNNVIDGSYFQGLQAVMNRHQKSKGAIARWSASWVPYSSFFRSMSRAYEVATEGNAKARETGNAYQKAFSQVLPWLVDKPPAKLDVWGEEAVIPGGVFRQWLPFKWVKEIDDPVEKEFEKLEFYPAVPSKRVVFKGEPMELDEDIYRKFVQTFGVRAKKRIHSIVTNPNYQRVSKAGTAEKRHRAWLMKEITKIKNSERRRAIREQRSK